VTQQRQFPRFALEAAVTLTVANQVVRGRTSNLSRGGICAMVDEAVPAGGRVEIEMALVFDNDSQSEPLSLSGRIVWCTPLGARFQVGLSFTALRSEQSKYLDMFLKFLQSGD
jgi:hypothetical protein